MNTNALRIQPFAEPTRIHQSDEFRQRALERLYERKAALDGLIASLEVYERVSPPPTRSVRVPVSAVPKCS